MAERKNNKITMLGEKLAIVTGKQPWGRQQYLFPLARHWSDIVGQEFAGHSMPAWFRRDVLWVYVQGSVWIQQMQLVKPELLIRINTFLQTSQTQVEDLRWQQQPADTIDVPLQEYVPPPLRVDPEAEREFRIMVENIVDPAVRQSLYNLWLHLTATKNST